MLRAASWFETAQERLLTMRKLAIAQPCAGIGAEYRDLVDGQHHREGDHQHRDTQHGNRGEVAAFVEVRRSAH